MRYLPCILITALASILIPLAVMHVFHLDMHIDSGAGSTSVMVFGPEHYIYLGHSDWSGWSFKRSPNEPTKPILHATRKEFCELLNSGKDMATQGEWVYGNDVSYTEPHYFEARTK